MTFINREIEKYYLGKEGVRDLFVAKKYRRVVRIYSYYHIYTKYNILYSCIRHRRNIYLPFYYKRNVEVRVMKNKK